MYLPTPSATSDFELPPEGGPYVAICTRFIDLGTQYSEHFNKSAHKVMIGWELAEPSDSKGRPYSIAKRYTFSMHEKSSFRKDLEAWRGKPFVASDFGPGGFSTAKLLGKACQMMIDHTQNGEKTYANVKTIMALGRGMTAPEAVSPLEYLALTPDEFDRKLFDSLSDGLKKIIEQAPEYKALSGGLGNSAAPRPAYQQQRTQDRAAAQKFTAAESALASKALHDDAALSADLNDEIPW